MLQGHCCFIAQEAPLSRRKQCISSTYSCLSLEYVSCYKGVDEREKNVEFHNNGIWEVLAFPLCHKVILLRMKLGTTHLAEFQPL